MLACSLFFKGKETSLGLVALVCENEKYEHVCLTSWFGCFVKSQCDVMAKA